MVKNRVYDKLVRKLSGNKLIKALSGYLKVPSQSLAKTPSLYPVDVYESDKEKIRKHLLEEEQKVAQWADCIKMLVRNHGVGKFRLSEDFPEGAMQKIANHVFSDVEKENENKASC